MSFDFGVLRACPPRWPWPEVRGYTPSPGRRFNCVAKFLSSAGAQAA